MKKYALSRKLARRTQLPAAEAADALDSVVHDLLVRLKAGNPVTWPGLGTFLSKGKFVAEVPPVKTRKRS